MVSVCYFSKQNTLIYTILHKNSVYIRNKKIPPLKKVTRKSNFCRIATMRVANSRYNDAAEFGNSAERVVYCFSVVFPRRYMKQFKKNIIMERMEYR